MAMLILLGPLVVFFLPGSRVPYMPRVSASSPLVGMSIAQYLRFRLPKTLFEIWPWFWGVFKWLGVVLPPLVRKIITRLSALSILGLSLRFILKVRDRKFTSEDKILILFLAIAISYYLYMIVWDYRLMQSVGYSIGLQGRYFFPVIIPIMGILFFGWLSLIPRHWLKFQTLVFGVLIFSIVSLNLVALYTVSKSYYDISSWKIFTTQLRQYKPDIVKRVFF